MFVSIDKQTLIVKNGGKRSISYETNTLMSFILMSRMSLWSQSWNKKRLLYESVFVLIDKWTFILKNGGKKSFSYETKSSMSLSQKGEWVYSFQSWKKKRLL